MWHGTAVGPFKARLEDSSEPLWLSGTAKTLGSSDKENGARRSVGRNTKEREEESFGLAAGHGEKQQAGISKGPQGSGRAGRVAGGGAEGSSRCAQRGTKTPHRPGGRSPRVGTHRVPTVFPPGSDPTRIHRKSHPLLRAAFPVSALPTGPEGRGSEPSPGQGLSGSPSRSALLPGRLFALSQTDSKRLAYLHPCGFRHGAPPSERAGGQGEPAHAGEAEPGEASRRLPQHSGALRGGGATAPGASRWGRTEPPLRARSGGTSGPHRRRAHGKPGERGPPEVRSRTRPHHLHPRGRPWTPARRPQRGPATDSRRGAELRRPRPAAGTGTRIPWAGEAAVAVPARTHPAPAVPAPPPSSAPPPSPAPVSVPAGPQPCRRRPARRRRRREGFRRRGGHRKPGGVGRSGVPRVAPGSAPRAAPAVLQAQGSLAPSPAEPRRHGGRGGSCRAPAHPPQLLPAPPGCPEQRGGDGAPLPPRRSL